MNENQIKMKIRAFKALDAILIFSFLGTAAYTYLYAENKELYIFITLGVLIVISIVGRLISRKVAMMRVQLDMLIRKNKTEEQRTLMSTRHTTRGGRTTVANTKTTPTKK